jgi:DNA-binding transcriptional LysR family regulator
LLVARDDRLSQAADFRLARPIARADFTVDAAADPSEIPVMAFSFRQIRYFVAVSESGSVSGAAHALSISQSTITESLHELESDLGFALFDRHPRGVSLTVKGRQFLRHAEKILADVATARRVLRETGRAVSGRLLLGVTPLVAGYVLADILARFRRAFPEVEVETVEDGRDYLEHLLVGGELDVALVILGEVEQPLAMNIEAIEQSRFRLWLPAGHALAQEAIVPVVRLAQEPHILLMIDEIAEAAGRAWRKASIRPPVAFRTRSVEAVRSLVATGAGVALLPDLTYRPWSLEGDKIEARQIEPDLPPVSVGIVWRRGAGTTAAIDGFIDVVRARSAS